MRRALLFLVLAGCAAGAPVERARDFELAALDGDIVRGAELWSDKSVLLVFMTAW